MAIPLVQPAEDEYLLCLRGSVAGVRELPYLLEEGVVQEGAGVWPGDKGGETHMTPGPSCQTPTHTLSSETLSYLTRYLTQ